MGHGELLDLMMYDGLQDPYTGRHMGEIGEANVARNGLTREEQDAIALRSYQLAQAAVKDGIFKDEIVPVIKTVRGTETVIDTDEEPFRVDFDKLSKLKTVFKKDGTITAGNASTINDGSAMLLLAGEAALNSTTSPPRPVSLPMQPRAATPTNFQMPRSAPLPRPVPRQACR